MDETILYFFPPHLCLNRLNHNRISYLNQIYFSVIRAPVVGLRPPIGEGTRYILLEVRTRYNRDYFMVALAYSM